MVDNLITDWSDDEALLDEFKAKKEKIIEQKEQLRAECNAALAILDQDAVKEMMESMTRDREGNNKVLEYIEQKFGVSYPRNIPFSFRSANWCIHSLQFDYNFFIFFNQNSKLYNHY